MSFVLPCPHCGPRPVDEFAYFGEVTRRPGPGSTLRDLTDYVYFRDNVAGEQREWNAHDIKSPIAGLAELLARGLGHTATVAASGADRAACHDAAACATRIHYLLTRPGP